MAKKKKDTTAAFSIRGFDMTHYRRTEAYTTAIENLYAKATTEISNAVASGTYDPDKPFAFSDYPRIASYVKQVMNKLASNVQAVISEGSRKEWLFACRKNDEFIKSIMDTAKLTKKRLEKMQDRNLDALKSFQTRKVEGLDLSQRVWKYTDQYRAQLELGLDVGLGEGRSAQQLARDVKQNLKYPDKLFRRVRDKRGNLQLSKAAKAFHPGTGVYRSSVKNAQRLTRSEINMAYRESDYLRWQQLDFVVGFDVHRSNHEPLCKCDLCAQLVGRYPKTFKFKGWHPQCMCYATPVLMDDDTFDANELGDLKAALRGTTYRHMEAKNAVTDVPDGFKEWVESHKEQQQGWKSVPYFIRDNFVDGLLEEGLKANVLPPPDPFKPLLEEIMPQVEQARALCKEWGLTAASGAMESGIAQKDIAQVKAGIAQATGEALNLEKELNAWLKQIQPLLPVAKSYGINVDSFAGYVAEATGNHAKWAVNRAKWQQAVTELENAIAEAKDNEKLSSLLVDVADAKAKYGSEAVHKVYDAVEKKLADISGIDGSLEYMKKKLEFEINWVSTYKKYSTWEVAAQAYQKKLDEVNYQLAKKQIESNSSDALQFAQTTKNAKVKQLAAELKTLLTSNAPIPVLQAKADELNAIKVQLQLEQSASGVFSEDDVSFGKGMSVSKLERKLKKKEFDEAVRNLVSKRIAENSMQRNGGHPLTDEERKKLNEISSILSGGEPDYNRVRSILKQLGEDLDDTYSQSRKDIALWCQSEEESKDKYSAYANKAFAKATKEEIEAQFGYTAGSGYQNRPLRGYYDGWGKENFKGIGNVSLNAISSKGAQHIKAFTELLNRCSYDFDVWLQRGVEDNGLRGFLGLSSLRESSVKAMVGKTICDTAFFSCGSAKGTGFAGNILNIYCPRGTKMLFVNGHSAYNSENETVIQRNTHFRITKVEYTGYRYFIDMEVVSQI